MYEVEVKAKLNDRKNILDKLISMGCIFGDELHQIDHIFIPNNVSFPPPFEMPVLRVRRQGNKSFFTLKISKSNRQDCVEHELEISDGERMIEIMKLINYKKVPIVNKKRIKANLNDIEIVIDSVENLGEFIEVEKMTNEENPNVRLEIQKELLSFLSELGIPEHDHIPGSKYDIMLYEKYGIE